MTDHGIKIGRCYAACKRCGKPLHYGDCAMTDPIGTAQERELIERLLAICPFLAAHHCSTDTITAAADALKSRIAEVGELREALDDCVASLAAIRATADNPDEWALSAEHFSTACLESLKVARAALSLQRRV